MIPVLILAGGKGTRLGSLAADIPKPMVPVLGRPLLEWQFDLAHQHKAPSVTIFAGHKAEVIADRYHGTLWNGMEIRVVVESTPLGTAGAVMAEYEQLPEEFFVLYGDTMTNVDLTRMWMHHARIGADATLYVHPNDHPYDSDLVEVDESGFVRAVHGYPHPEGIWRRNLVNAALYIFKKKALGPWADKSIKSDFAKHLIPAMFDRGIPIAAYRGYDYIKDMGTPDRLTKVESDVRSGLLDLKRSSNRRASVFIDRDGTINREVDHLNHPDLVELLAGVPEAIRRLNNSAMPVAVITNQPVIARGEASVEMLASIHGKIDNLLGRDKAFIDSWYYCPHHPDRGFAGEVPELKKTCNCRKPETGMVDQAFDEMPVLFRESWLIGDTTTDVLTAKRAGLRSILVRTGYAGCDDKYPIRPDHIAPDLAAAVDFILDVYPNMAAKAREIATSLNGIKLIAITGHAHSGKSSFASALVEALRDQGKKSEVVSLDGFIVPEGLRGRGFDFRHDIGGIRSILARIIEHQQSNLVLEIPQYNRLRRAPSAKPETITLTSDTIVVLEGVVIPRVPEILDHADAVLWVDVSERIRKDRFIRDYEWRGMKPSDAESLWEQRVIDETFPPPEQSKIITL